MRSKEDPEKLIEGWAVEEVIDEDGLVGFKHEQADAYDSYIGFIP